jgi:hypothetical protein
MERDGVARHPERPSESERRQGRAIWRTRRASRCVRGEERSLDCAPFAAQGKRDDGVVVLTKRMQKSRPEASGTEGEERSLDCARDDSG